jgi:CheY-like chemotaxis protein
MDAATLSRATEPFFTSKPKDRGTGLGLSMADGFAAQSGGALRIESAPGSGTTVTLWLPQAAGIDMAEGKTSHSEAKPPRRRALVVDDVAVMRRFLSDCLDHAGWEAVEASGTEEALALLQTDGPFELLMADLLMPPGPDGLVLIREAQAQQPGLPAILISGSEALAGTPRDGFAVLRKPVSPAELSAFLETLSPK